jgi:osmotically-inducible protein OsmY
MHTNNSVSSHLRSGTLAAIMLATGLILNACASGPTSESAGQYVDDSTITAKVKTSLAADPITKARQINVETYKGVVQLSGFVDSDNERRRALVVARNVRGVTEVEDKMTLKTHAE